MYADNATPKQVAFIESLLKDRDVDDEQKADILLELHGAPTADGDSLGLGMMKGRASHTIDWLTKLPRKAQPVTASYATHKFPDVAEGRYAIEHEGVLKFFRVEKPVTGKYAGWTFLDVQASDELHPIKKFETKFQILDVISKAPHEAQLRYAAELGRCYVCGRTLTDEQSRALGIGPVCRGEKGVEE